MACVISRLFTKETATRCGAALRGGAPALVRVSVTVDNNGLVSSATGTAKVPANYVNTILGCCLSGG